MMASPKSIIGSMHQFMDEEATEGLASVHDDGETIYGGYDYSFHPSQLTLAAKHEIADEMMRRWQSYKARLPELGGAGDDAIP